jgi:hypothetical protein
MSLSDKGRQMDLAQVVPRGSQKKFAVTPKLGKSARPLADKYIPARRSRQSPTDGTMVGEFVQNISQFVLSESTTCGSSCHMPCAWGELR